MGMFLGVILAVSGCALSFDYPRYAVDPERDLLLRIDGASDGSDDRSLSRSCRKTGEDGYRCVLFPRDVAIRLQRDYRRCMEENRKLKRNR